ncbi:unnamed protein product [Amoebophrya sp. A120]|nr:unnamed protein product [Amoebophrya sp. A120]|eukprot:GSA120T00004010001.1
MGKAVGRRQKQKGGQGSKSSKGSKPGVRKQSDAPARELKGPVWRHKDSDASQAALKRNLQLKRLLRIKKPTVAEKCELANLYANHNAVKKACDLYKEILGDKQVEKKSIIPDVQLTTARARYACLLLDTEQADVAREVLNANGEVMDAKDAAATEVKQDEGSDRNAADGEKHGEKTNAVTVNDEDISDFPLWVQVRLKILERFEEDKEEPEDDDGADSTGESAAVPADRDQDQQSASLSTAERFQLLVAHTAQAWTLVAIEYISHVILEETESSAPLTEAIVQAARVNPFVAEVLADKSGTFLEELFSSDSFIEKVAGTCCAAKSGKSSGSCGSKSSSSSATVDTEKSAALPFSIAHFEAVLVYFLNWAQLDVWSDIDGFPAFIRGALPSLIEMEKDHDGRKNTKPAKELHDEKNVKKINAPEEDDENSDDSESAMNDSIEFANFETTSGQYLNKARQNLLSTWRSCRRKSQEAALADAGRAESGDGLEEEDEEELSAAELEDYELSDMNMMLEEEDSDEDL